MTLARALRMAPAALVLPFVLLGAALALPGAAAFSAGSATPVGSGTVGRVSATDASAADVHARAVLTTVPTSSATVSPTLTATAPVSATATVEPGATVTPTLTVTPTATTTVTPTLTVTPAAAPSASPTASPRPRRAAYLPWAGRDALPEGAPPPYRSWGAQLALDHDPASHADDVLVELPRMRGQGLRSVRTHLYWDGIEPRRTEPPTYDWRETDRLLRDYAEAGFDVVLSLVSYPRWALTYQCGFGYEPGGEEAWRRFVRAAAARYGDAPYSVVAWEIGNEVDGETRVEAEDWERDEAWGRGQPTVPHGGCWGDRAAAYVGFLRAAREEIRAADPDGLVTLGNLALVDHPAFEPAFLEAFLDAGGGAQIDYFGYHWFPDLADFFPDWGLPDGPAKYRQVRDALARRGLRMPIWLTETYRLSREGRPVSERAQVSFLSRELVRLAAETELERIYWYGWVDFPGQPEGALQRGAIRADRRPKLAFGAPLMAALAETTDGYGRDLSAGRVRAYAFRPIRGAGDRFAAWSADGNAATWSLPAPAGTVAHSLRFVEVDGRLEPRRASHREQGGLVRIPLGAETTFLRFGHPPLDGR